MRLETLSRSTLQFSGSHTQPYTYYPDRKTVQLCEVPSSNPSTEPRDVFKFIR